MDPLASSVSLPHLQTLLRLALALGLGLFVGVEREWRHKEAGLRTFGFAALLGALGGLLGWASAMISLGLIGILVVLVNWRAIVAEQKLELTTSAAMLITGYVGVLSGAGHTFTPVVVAIATALLLAWKEQLAGFSLGLTAAELRSAILLAVLAFIIYPVLPADAIDPWGLIQPRAAWVTVILIASLGFTNYVLLKIYGARGVQITGFLGGLVNSTVTVAELSRSSRESEGRLRAQALRGALLATCAMGVRNAVLLGIVATSALFASLLPIALMLSVSFVLAMRLGREKPGEPPIPALQLRSPFSLISTLKFGLIFLVLQVGGTLAQDALGKAGFFAVSIVGGAVSSASAVAAAAMLAAQGHIDPLTAGAGAVLASLSSAAMNYVVAARISKDPKLNRPLGAAIALVVAAGIAGALVQSRFPSVANLVPAMLGSHFSNLKLKP